jgi:RDD family
MTGGPGWPSQRPYPSLPQGLEVARMPVRFGAWLIDTLILGVVFVAVMTVASIAGAIGISPEAQRQLESAPNTLPTVTPYVANLPLLAVFAAAIVVLNVGYATVFVAWMRGLPGQVALSLQIGDAVTGRNLGLGRSFLRAVLSVGIPTAGAVGLLYLVVALQVSVPWADVVDPQPGGAAEVWLSSRVGPMLLSLIALVVWPVVLLISTGASYRRQGLHDLAARSQVVGRSRASIGAAYAPGHHPTAWPSGFGPPSTGSLAASNPPVDTVPGAPDEPDALQSPPDAWTEPDGKGADSGKGPERAPLWPSFTAEDNAPSKVRGATVIRRVVAYGIDCVAVYTIFSLIQSILLITVLKSVSPADSAMPIFDERTSILVGLLGGILQIIYFVPAWVVLKATLGQRLTHIEVADASTGKALGWMDAFLRWTVIQGPLALVTIVPQVAAGPVVFAATAWTFFLLYSTQNSRDWRGFQDRFVNSRVAREP